MTQTLPSIGLKDEADVPDAAPASVEPIDSDEGSTGNRPFVSIVVPYYNPGDRLRETVGHLVRVLEGSGLSFEIITVSDGSTDGSPSFLDEFPGGVVRQVAYATNVGKGYALRTGLEMGSGRYLGFIDADGDISPEFLATFLSVMQTEKPDMIIGSKRHPDSTVHWTPLRRFYSSLHQCLIRGLFRLDVKDTQVGLKLMDRRVATEVLPLLCEDRFALDLELLVLARRLGYTRVIEAPVRIEERLASTMSLKRAWRLLADTVGIFVRVSVRHQYGRGIAPGSVIGAPEGPVGTPRRTAAPNPIPA